MLPEEERTVAPDAAVERVTGLTVVARVEAVRAAEAERVAEAVRVLATIVPARLVLLTRVPRPETTLRPAGWVALRAVQTRPLPL